MSMNILIPTSALSFSLIDLANTNIPKFATDPTWSNATTYSINNRVKVASANNKYIIYRSLQNTNLNNNPASSAAYWGYVFELPATYISSTTYAINDYVVDLDGYNIYKSLQNSNTGKLYAADAATYWQLISAAPLYSLFDNNIVTLITGSKTPIVLTFDVTTGINFVSVFGVKAVSVGVVLKDSGGTTRYTSTKTINTSTGSFTADIAWDDIPSTYTSGKLEITFTSTDTVAVSSVFYGLATNIGTLMHGSSVGVVDYSKKEAQPDGSYSITVGAFSKRIDFRIACEPSSLNTIYNTFDLLRSAGAVYCGYADGVSYQPLLAYGFYRQFSVEISYPTQHLCTLEVEGLSQ